MKKDLSNGLVCDLLEAGYPPKRIADLLELPLAAAKFDDFWNEWNLLVHRKCSDEWGFEDLTSWGCFK